MSNTYNSVEKKVDLLLLKLISISIVYCHLYKRG